MENPPSRPYADLPKAASPSIESRSPCQGSPQVSHSWPVALNIIDQDFAADGPNQKWGVDISYVWTREGWLYLAVLIDRFSRRVVGRAVGDRLHRRLAIAALRTALTIRRPPQGLIHHSDRGSQFRSIDYQAVLRIHGIRISMSGKGNCYDNAMVETFFKTLKSELVWRTTFFTCAHAQQPRPGSNPRWMKSGGGTSEAILDLYFPHSKDNRRFSTASFDCPNIVEALQSCQIDEPRLPGLKADWYHCRLDFPDDAARDLVWQILISAGAYASILNLSDGAQLADVLLSPESRSALAPSRERIAHLSPQIEALLYGPEAGLSRPASGSTDCP